MKDKFFLDEVKFAKKYVARILTPEVLDKIYYKHDYELAQDLIFQTQVKSIENIEDSVFSYIADWETEEDELWERLAYLEIDEILCEQKYAKAYMQYAISYDDELLFNKNRSNCKYKPKCAYFIGNYSNKNLSEINCKHKIKKAISTALADGYNIFIVGLFTKAELWITEELQKISKRNKNIKVIYATLYNGYEYNTKLHDLDKGDIKCYQKIMQTADNIKYFFDTWASKKYLHDEFLWQENLMAYLWMINYSQKGIGIFYNPGALLKTALNYSISRKVNVENLLYSRKAKEQKNVVTIVGDRPELLAFNYTLCDSKDKIEDDICNLLREAIADKIKNGTVEFIIRTSKGVGLWAAKSILEYRKENHNIKLTCVVPYTGMEQKWEKSDKELYHQILKQADTVKYMSESYSPDCFNECNKYLVDNSDEVISAYADFHGGVRGVLKYAMKNDKKIKNIIMPIYYEYDC